MKKFAVLCIFLLASFQAESKTPPNVLLICVDDLRPELACYGKDYIQSPHIDRLASEGVLFNRHYVQSPTCSASRYALLTGNYGPSHNSALSYRAKKIMANPGSVSPSLPHWFRMNKYATVSIGKVSHYVGGYGGPEWNNEEFAEMPNSWDRSLMPCGPWKTPKGTMHGLANGERRKGNKQTDLFQSFEGSDLAYPDGLITEEAINQLEELASGDQPFFLAVGFIRPHLPFGAPAKYNTLYTETDFPPIPHPIKPEGTTTWHDSYEFKAYNMWGKDLNQDRTFALDIRRHYAACVSYIDNQVGRVVDKLKSLDLGENTIILLWGDHGYHLGEHAIWGKHTLFEESLRSPLIIRYPCHLKAGQKVETIVESVDLFPTLVELSGLPAPSNLDGESILCQLEKPEALDQNAVSYNGAAVSLRTDTHRLIIHNDGSVELYRHDTPQKETLNMALEEPETVIELALDLHELFPERLTEDLISIIKKQFGPLLKP